MHRRRRRRSAYCATAPDAFRGTAPINLTDRLHQVLRWAAGSLEIFFSRNNALLAGGGRRLHPLQRVAYAYLPQHHGVPVHLRLPGGAARVREDRSLLPRHASGAPSATYIGFLAALMLTLAAVAVLEVRWSGITLGEWWWNEQFWMVSATSAYLAAVAQVVLKVAAGKEISFHLTSKTRAAAAAGAGGGKDRFEELYAVRWTVLMVPPAAALAVSVVSMAAGMTGGRWRNGPAAALDLAFNVWVAARLYPFALGVELLMVFFSVRMLYYIVQFDVLG
ncbi:hypothetical protein ACP4OV_005630 [Aristida adscensionis]